MGKLTTFKCKPVWQFQSVEFDVQVESDKDFENMKELYKKVLDMLVELAPVQEKKILDVPATEKQKQVMKINGIPFTASTTSKEAQALIEAAINKAKNRT